MKDVVNDIEYGTDYPYGGVFYADRGFNVIHFRRAWTGCHHSRKLTFDTLQNDRPDTLHFRNYLRDHVFPGDAIIAVGIDEPYSNIGPAAETLLSDFNVDVSSLSHR